MTTTKTYRPNFNITILDDDIFYNKLIKNQIKGYFEDFGVINHCKFNVAAYDDQKDLLGHINSKTNVVILDYYLQNGTNAIDVMNKIKKVNKNCKFLIISGSQNVDTFYKTHWNGASGFIKKDKFAGLKACRLIEDLCINNNPKIVKN